MKHYGSFAVFVFGLTLMLVIAGTSGLQEARAEASANCFGGSYLVVDDGSGERRLWTLTKEGEFLGTASAQPVRNFSNQQGAWERNGPLEVAATLLNFSFDAVGDLSGTTRNDITMRFTRGCQEASGEFSLRFFDLGTEDPLDTDTDTGSPVTGSFTARRITVE